MEGTLAGAGLCSNASIPAQRARSTVASAATCCLRPISPLHGARWPEVPLAAVTTASDPLIFRSRSLPSILAQSVASSPLWRVPSSPILASALPLPVPLIATYEYLSLRAPPPSFICRQQPIPIRSDKLELALATASASSPSSAWAPPQSHSTHSRLRPSS
ncbi:hypothetical protein ACCO45_001331 [Purpureocillium lilacinum]|uniref:Uncharacterized protein n=1 Tax=Purpureocillium lilacinum TaxID=33203 RepID=A0ACC4E6S1_PURLI